MRTMIAIATIMFVTFWAQLLLGQNFTRYEVWTSEDHSRVDYEDVECMLSGGLIADIVREPSLREHQFTIRFDSIETNDMSDPTAREICLA